MHFDILPERREIERARNAKRTVQRPTPLREGNASPIRMHGGTSTGKPPGGVRNGSEAGRAGHRNHAQQLGSDHPLPATHTRADRGRLAHHVKVYRVGRLTTSSEAWAEPDAAPDDSSTGSAGGASP